MKQLAIAISFAVLAGCGTPSTPAPPAIQTKLITPYVPPDLFDCGTAPDVPASNSQQSAVARYIVALWGWGNRCQSHLLAVQQSLSQPTGTAKPTLQSGILK